MAIKYDYTEEECRETREKFTAARIEASANLRFPGSIVHPPFVELLRGRGFFNPEGKFSPIRALARRGYGSRGGKSASETNSSNG